MKIVFASDSFKGSLSSGRICELLGEAAQKVFPGCETTGLYVADGGEGTVDAVVAANEGAYREVLVHDPLMNEIPARYGVFGDSHAVIEMSAASGLPLVPPELRDPLNTTTYGTGEMIRDAIEHGFENIAIAIGGSATNDGGMGAMQALGVLFLDAEGNPVEGNGAGLENVAKIDTSNLYEGIKRSKITIMCDVTNPLTGPNGATYTFGPQKGATTEKLEVLERGMVNYAARIKEALGIDVNDVRGAGAAGGLGAALYAFLGGTMKSGIDTVLDLVEFDEKIGGADLVITGEGRIDWQSAFGKVPSGVGKRSRAQGIPCIAIVGGIGKGAEAIYEHGVESIISTINGPMELSEAMECAEELYAGAAERALRMVRVGMGIKK